MFSLLIMFDRHLTILACTNNTAAAEKYRDGRLAVSFQNFMFAFAA